VVTRATHRHPHMMQLLARWMQESLQTEGCLVDSHAPCFPFTSIDVSINVHNECHRDDQQQGPTLMRTLGAFTGGQLRYWRDDITSMDVTQVAATIDCQLIDARQRWVLIDGKRAHAFQDFGGEFFSMMFYTCPKFKCTTHSMQESLRGRGARWPSNELVAYFANKLEPPVSGPPSAVEPPPVSMSSAMPTSRPSSARKVNERRRHCPETSVAKPARTTRQTRKTRASEVAVVKRSKLVAKNKKTRKSKTKEKAARKKVPKGYKVLRFPNLGLKLSLGKSYTRGELLDRCQGSKSKETSLLRMLEDSKVFKPVFHTLAKGET